MTHISCLSFLLLESDVCNILFQCCHAAVMAYEQLYKRHPQLLEEWRYHGQPKVVLRTDSEAQLLVNFHQLIICLKLGDVGCCHPF
jgi:peptidyl-tRNA hydrolase